MARILPFIRHQFFDSDGNPLVGGKIYTYVAGTTTPLATYTDKDEGTENANPIILDANGEASIWVGDAFYKFVIADANDVVLRTIDKVTSASDVTAEATAAQVAAEAAQAAAEAARDAALTAETNAETAETNAETAETNAETAQAAAEAARDAALTAETNAELAETNAEAAQVAAESARDDAETAATAAQAAQSAAETARNGAELAEANAEAASSAAFGLAEYANDAAYEVAHGAAEAGDIYYNTTLSKVRVYTNAWGSLGGGGGGSSLNWIEDAAAPLASFEYSQLVYSFMDAETQFLYAAVRVPSTYSAGSQINLRGLFYANATANTVLMQTLATLIRTGTDAVSSTTNQRTSTNSAITLATTANKPNSFVCDLTDSGGQINGVGVSAGDLILVRLTRDTATDTSTADAVFPPYCSEVTFS